MLAGLLWRRWGMLQFMNLQNRMKLWERAKDAEILITNKTVLSAGNHKCFAQVTVYWYAVYRF